MWSGRTEIDCSFFILIQFPEGVDDAGSEELENAFYMMHK